MGFFDWLRGSREAEPQLNPGMTVRMRRKVGHTDVEIGLTLKQVAAYLDQVIEFTPVIMVPGDSLQITYKLNCAAYVEGRLTDIKPLSATGTYYAKSNISMRYARFRKLGERTWVTALEDWPLDVPDEAHLDALHP